MEIWIVVIILGVVEGLTEFIPVSSTGHLIVAGNLLGFTGPKASSFEVAIQLGAILSVVYLYRKRFLALIPNKKDSTQSTNSAMEGWSGLCRIGLATIPALIAGYLFHDTIKSYLFTPVSVSWALALGGVGILAAEKHAPRGPTQTLDTLTLKQAFGIGLFQMLSLWPGTSRSAATIVGGLLLGLDRKRSAEFSFLIAVPILLAATGYEFINMGSVLTTQELFQLSVGLIVSYIVGLLAVATFIRLLSRWTLAPFAWYRIVAAPTFYLLTYGLSF